MIDLKKFEIPGHVALAEGNGGLPKLLVDTDAASAEIYLHGAHLTAFRKKDETPLLFLSKDSDYEAGQPIRGGVPVIFPWFGGRDGLPHHGFARTVEWDIKETSLFSDGTVKLRFAMPAVKSYDVEYDITIGETLTMELIVLNSGEKETEFETCLHSYFRIGAIERVSVTGLTNAGYLDQVTREGSLDTAAPLRIDGETDRAYFDTTAAVEIEDPVIGRRIRIEKSGSLSTVVWNPGIAKSKELHDLGDDEYLTMLCVEAGNVGKNKVVLLPGQSAVLRAVVSTEALA